MKQRYEPVSMGGKKKERRKVSWNDGKIDGPIAQGYLTEGTAATLKKEKMNDQAEKLIEQGYTEIEAAVLAGKQTVKTETLWNHPLYHMSHEEIEKQKLKRDQLAVPAAPSLSSTAVQSPIILPFSPLFKEKEMEKTSSSPYLFLAKEKEVESPISLNTGSVEIDGENSIAYPPVKQEKGTNPYTFFSAANIGMSIAALAVAATIGIVASRK